MLAAEPDLQPVTPAATTREIRSTPHVDVIVLVGHLEAHQFDVLSTGRVQDSAAWVVLVEDAAVAEDTAVMDQVLAAGAHGCLVVSSTPVQIGAAVRAAARGQRAALDQPVTGPLVQRTPRATPPLTDRELEILRLVDAGLGNQQIAERLYLSRSSVKSHLSHTYGRLGVTRRSAAVAEARRQGLI